jgi:hypothetical protein
MCLQFELSYVRLGGREAEEALPYGNFFAKKESKRRNVTVLIAWL